MNFQIFFWVSYIFGNIAVTITSILAVYDFRTHREIKRRRNEGNIEKIECKKYFRQFLIMLIESIVCYMILQVIGHVIFHDEEIIIRDIIPYILLFAVGNIIPLTDGLKAKLCSVKTFLLMCIVLMIELVGGVCAIMVICGCA